MKRLTLAAAILGFAAAPITAAATATATPGPMANPTGSYTKSCLVIGRFDGAMLTATCRPEASALFRSSSIDTRSCAAEVFNRDGGLQCYARPGTWGSGRAVPRGGYIDSCKDAVVAADQHSLAAQCKDRGGQYRAAQLALDRCHLGDAIDNNDGQLVCRRP